MRLQLALNVRDIDEAVDYYGKLFGATPHKRRPGYANFAIDAPPLKLVLFEKPDAEERLNHLGVEVFDGALVRQAGDRLEAADILTEVEEETVCCHATQTKVWSHEPQGLRWEWYVVTDDAPDGRVLIDPARAACATDSEDCCA
ncbi:ArsI/CadI family heavy metal resistance metalloenzyme [Candidatus Palauibacter sp.]|uniref:ArsI/CadI family heavy metal resistance metalloenzyme n=1 Tax=Candidatus Palauibacter sp. TaxID=3101350 RepID=UPI003CC649A6